MCGKVSERERHRATHNDRLAAVVPRHSKVFVVHVGLFSRDGVTLTLSHYTYVDLKDVPQIVELAVRVAADRNLAAGCNRNVGEGWECRQELAKQLQNLVRILSVQRFLIFKGFNQLHAKLNRYLAIQVRSFVVGGGGGVGVVVERVVTSAYWNAQCQHKLAGGS